MPRLKRKRKQNACNPKYAKISISSYSNNLHETDAWQT
jgi:hypothetical protein